MFSFTLETLKDREQSSPSKQHSKTKTKTRARRGVMRTPHGEVQTPIFMPVGTQATVKALAPEDLNKAKAQIILANTYHLHLRPGEETVMNQGGVQKFMNWNKPMLTDSGGFQVFSLGAQKERSKSRNQTKTESLAKISDDGVEFFSHHDGSKHFFTPEIAIEIQQKLGADIIMAFDECTPDDVDKQYVQAALNRTISWAQRCKQCWESHDRKSPLGHYQALFGIVQGAMHEDLRKEATEAIVGMEFDGVAVGGETIGYNMEGTVQVMDWIEDRLPKNKPRYAMGLGRDPQDIIDAVRAGFDMFDCVAPTRLARNGALYSGQVQGDSPDTWAFSSEFNNGRLQIGNSRWIRDASPIQESCDCWTCAQGFSRAYLHHLYQAKELLYYRLASIHNVRFMLRLTEYLRSTM